jgi:hypothetical protein
MSTITNSDLQRSVEDEFFWDPMVGSGQHRRIRQ